MAKEQIQDLDLTPEFVPLPQGDVELSQADTTISKKSLCWGSSITLEKGLAQLFEKVR